MILEENHIARGSGKWSQQGVPHRGWICTGIEDLGSLDAVCEMCESQSIRYIHYMEHPNYDGSLGVGCICAGNMEQDYEAAKARERSLKNVAQRRNKWLKRSWRISAKGNPYLNTDGFNIVLFKINGKWSGIIKNRNTGEQQKVRRRYSTLEEAKLAAFDAMIFMKQQ